MTIAQRQAYILDLFLDLRRCEAEFLARRKELAKTDLSYLAINSQLVVINARLSDLFFKRWLLQKHVFQLMNSGISHRRFLKIVKKLEAA